MSSPVRSSRGAASLPGRILRYGDHASVRKDNRRVSYTYRTELIARSGDHQGDQKSRNYKAAEASQSSANKGKRGKPKAKQFNKDISNLPLKFKNQFRLLLDQRGALDKVAAKAIHTDMCDSWYESQSVVYQEYMQGGPIITSISKMQREMFPGVGRVLQEVIGLDAKWNKISWLISRKQQLDWLVEV